MASASLGPPDGRMKASATVRAFGQALMRPAALKQRRPDDLVAAARARDAANHRCGLYGAVAVGEVPDRPEPGTVYVVGEADHCSTSRGRPSTTPGPRAQGHSKET